MTAVNRRGFLGVAGALGLGWRALAADPGPARARGVSCIVIWMGGGPSQFESFDPKPGTDTGGPTRAIQTAAPDVRIAEGWERTAAVLGDVALVRSVTHLEGEHGRASFYTKTGYNPSPAVAYPALGSVAAAAVGPADFDLPHFVRVSASGVGAGAGFLGARVAPFQVADPNRMPANVVPPGGAADPRLDRRLGLLDKVAAEQTADDPPRAEEQRALYDRARRMMRSPRLPAFDLSREPDRLRDEYGRNPVGQGCLLARRLVEAGVTFVEVASSHPDAPAAWDTHIDNFAVTAKLVGWADPAGATLVRDLKDRGLLDRTLVVWMGEFGRTPKINDRGKTGGRDHYPRAFSAALAGAGVRGGRVVGATDPKGVAVSDRPVRVPDLLATLCDRLGVDHGKSHKAPGGLRVKVVDDGTPVAELWG